MAIQNTRSSLDGIMYRILPFLLLLSNSSVFSEAGKEKTWQKLENCRFMPNKGNDGDSFHVMCDKEYLFRLYFVDTPESEQSLPARIAEQASYFKTSNENSIKLGKDAKIFTENLLTGKSLTIWTRWRDAMGRSKMQRFYALIYVDKKDLAESLVANGLARIYGTRTSLPDGKDSRTYLANLAALEIAAKKTKLGGWKNSSK